MKCFLHSNEKLAHIAGVKHIPNVSTFVAPKPGATLDVDEEVQEGVAKGTIWFKISEVNDVNYAFTCDFLLYSKWLAPELANGEQLDQLVDQTVTDKWHPHFKFRNAIDESMEYERAWIHHISESGIPVVWKYQRHKGTFYQHFNLMKFPFDVQDLTVIIDSSLPSSAVTFVCRDDVPPSFSGRAFQLSEWEFLSPLTQSSILTSPTGLRFPQFVLNLPVQRHYEFYIWNVIVIECFLVMLTLSSFALEPSALADRMSITLTLLLTQVAFKFAIDERIPKIPYLTVLDKYMLLGILLMTLVCAVNVAVATPIGTMRKAILQMFGIPKQQFESEAGQVLTHAWTDFFACIGVATTWVLATAKTMLHAYRRENVGDNNGHSFVPGDLEGKGWDIAQETDVTWFAKCGKGEMAVSSKEKKTMTSKSNRRLRSASTRRKKTR
eukprot:Stramenopile-MAST_4_protein_3884